MMKIGTNLPYNSKLGSTPKEKPRSNDLFLNRNEFDQKPILNLASTSNRHQFSSFVDTNPGDHSRQHTTTSTPKTSNTTSAQPNLLNSSSKHGLPTHSDSKKSFLVSELKNEILANKTQPDSKRLYFGKVNSETSSNSSKKVDTSVGGTRKANNQPKTDSRGTSKDERFVPDSPVNRNNRKERLFGSYDPTPTNSEYKKPQMRTEMASSGKKTKEFDLRDLLTSKKMTTSPNKKVSGHENPYSQKESAYSSSKNLFLNQKATNVTNNRVERGKNAQVLFNNLMSPSSKSNQRSFTKDPTRSYELDASKHNNSNDSIKLTAKTPSSSMLSKGNRTPTSNSHLNDSGKMQPFSNYSAVGASSASVVSRNNKESKNSQSFASLYKEKRTNYQEILRGKRVEYEKSYVNQSTANQTAKSSTGNTNSLESSDRLFSNKSSNLATEIYNRLALSTLSTKSSTRFKSLDLPKHRDGSHDQYNFKSGNILSEDTSLMSPEKRYTGQSVTEHQSRSELEDFPQVLLHSQLSSKSGSRSHSAAQNIQEIIEFEKKKHEALKHRISLNLEAFKANKANLETTTALLGAHSKTNKLFENQADLKMFTVQETYYPQTTKHSMLSQNFEFNSGEFKRNLSTENFTNQIIPTTFELFDREGSPEFGNTEFIIETEDTGSKQQQHEDNGSEISFKQTPFEEADKSDLTPKNIAFIEYEEVPINEQERRINSREKKNTYKLESDRTELPTTERNHHTPESVEKSAFPEPGSLITGSHGQNQTNKLSPEESAETIEHLLKLVARLKRVLEEDRNREQAWKDEKSQMQKRIEELEQKLSKYES